MLEVDEAEAREGSKAFENAHLTVYEPWKYSPQEVEAAFELLGKGGAGLEIDLGGGLISKDFAERMFVGLYHYRGHIPPQPLN